MDRIENLLASIVRRKEKGKSLMPFGDDQCYLTLAFVAITPHFTVF